MTDATDAVIDWTPALVVECRNRQMRPFRLLSAVAQCLIANNFPHVEVYCEANVWRPVMLTGSCHPDPRRAYRISPQWNPLITRL